jgi:hypothetical protein
MREGASLRNLFSQTSPAPVKSTCSLCPFYWPADELNFRLYFRLYVRKNSFAQQPQRVSSAPGCLIFSTPSLPCTFIYLSRHFSRNFITRTQRRLRFSCQMRARYFFIQRALKFLRVEMLLWLTFAPGC